MSEAHMKALSSSKMSPFKVVIAGGSVVGLSLALVFERMGVEYVLLEKGQIAPQIGASLGIHPHSLKILDQLGVWEDIAKQTLPLLYREHMDGDGNVFEASWVLKYIQENLQRPTIFMERCEALRILYKHIQFKDRIHTNTSLLSYTQDGDGVSVIASDGLTYRGDILIGADGIHSRVRQIMSEEIRVQDPTLSKAIDEGFKSEYKTLFAISRNDPEHQFLPDRHVHNVYYDHFSGIAAVGVRGLVFWFLFVKTDPSTTPNCPRYTDEDAQNLIDQFDDTKLGPSYTFGDLWRARVKATLASMEEGVTKNWSFGRVLCMGDAVHKSTINPGLGGNLAYEGIAHFTNLLHNLLQNKAHPSTAELASIFQAFDEKHRPRANTVVSMSGQITRYEAQDSWILKFASRYVVPRISDKMKANLYSNFSRGGPHLEFLPLPAQDQIEFKAKKVEESGFTRYIPHYILAWVGAVSVVGVAVWMALPLKSVRFGEIMGH